MTAVMNSRDAQADDDVQTKDSTEIKALVFVRDRGIVVLWIVLILAFSMWASPFFGTWGNAVLIANAAAVAALYAAGVGVGVMSGALDISIPGVAALAGVVCGKLVTSQVSVGIGIVLALLVGVSVGIVNGLIALRGYNPLIITIGTLSVTSGLAAVVSGGYAIPGLTQLTFMGTARYLGLPAPVWIVIVLYTVLTVFITQTRHGLRFMAVGGNMEAVRRCGINSSVYRVLGFAIGGLCAALGGVVSAAVSSEANPSASPGIIFTALTAVALSGVALTGGRGSLPRVLVGALILATISNALTIKGIQPYWSTIVTGLLLLFALGMESSVKTAVERRLMKAATASAHSGRR
ncbi:ABC transporter permease [Pseudonocardia sp. CA-107938]|uniref:ABC transporter permease n=1 Tax=Pseudonocardia sp. CA-107938 TaxID=3240021 RepID=UPI003D90972F